MSRILVTGGSGFIGSGLVKALVKAGHSVRVLDDNSRGSPRRLAEVANDIEFIAGDIRNAAVVVKAAQDMDEIHHLAFVNGTEFFYSQPDLVLDVGVRGMVSGRWCSRRVPRSTRHHRKFRPTRVLRSRSPIRSIHVIPMAAGS